VSAPAAALAVQAAMFGPVPGARAVAWTGPAEVGDAYGAGLAWHAEGRIRHRPYTLTVVTWTPTGEARQELVARVEWGPWVATAEGFATKDRAQRWAERTLATWADGA
jgi:hypothetical protein